MRKLLGAGLQQIVTMMDKLTNYHRLSSSTKSIGKALKFIARIPDNDDLYQIHVKQGQVHTYIIGHYNLSVRITA